MTEQLIDIEPLPENREAIRKLRLLSDTLQEKGVRSALRVAAKPQLEALRRAAPDDPKTAGSRLSQAMNITQARTGTRVRTGAGGRYVDLKADEVGLVVGPNKRVTAGDSGIRQWAWLAWILEVGSKQHQIRPRRQNRFGLLYFDGRWHKSVTHRGSRRHMGWMSKSYTPLAEEAFYQGLEKWLDKNYGR